MTFKGVRIHILLVALVVTAAARPAVAQGPEQPGAKLTAINSISNEDFSAAWNRVARRFAGDLSSATGVDARKAVYRAMLEQFLADPRFTARRSSPEYQAVLARLVLELPDSALAQSTNAPITNPASNQLIERSGSTQLLALAGDFKKLFSADESAVSLNLNAVALLGGGKAGERSAQYLYSKREGWRRLSGTITFGAKVPEKAITGLSGLPDADKLFDALSWDVKVRVAGDRDPRATRWYPLMIGRMGDTVELLGRIAGLPVDPSDVKPLLAAANELLGVELSAATRQIASSLQASVKGSGVHLTNVEGKNKYAVAFMLDKGFNMVDVTANVSYNVADVPQQGATDPFKTKDIQLSAGLTGSILKNAIVTGRAVEVSGSLKGRLFVDDDSVPLDRKNIFNLNATLTLPFQLKATIPVSFTWTNDPNNLTKEKYVSGQIGISYDFAAIWDVLKNQ
jgi:hypothetical protein